MKVLGIIVEYNPMHEGHLHHLEKAKELVNPDITIAVMSGNFVQRGEPAIIDKFKRSEIAIKYGVDLVVELPLVYSVESSDYFCKEAISILNSLSCTDIVFGSESGNINDFKEIAKAIYQNEDKYNELIKDSMNEGNRYPDACNKALSILLNKQVSTPNDILGLGYVKEIIKNNYNININCIKRTGEYFSLEESDNQSAFNIRNNLKKGNIPDFLLEKDSFNQLYYLDDFYNYLKYIILTSKNEELQSLHLVDEGIENALKSNILVSTNMEEFINSLTSKRYTRSRIQRMIIHILLKNTKEDIKKGMNTDFIRVLKMNNNGQKYLSLIKGKTNREIVSNFSKYHHPALDIELKGDYLLSLLSDNKIINDEYSNIPIIK
ncbi:MAG: nucleotidyltransferase [Thomasclavelia sp.]|nr:nucleotidyltransferase [Thomasclavelia sp.]